MKKWSHVFLSERTWLNKPLMEWGKMAQQVRGLATKLDCLSSLLGTHKIEGGNWFMKMNMKEGRMWTYG